MSSAFSASGEDVIARDLQFLNTNSEPAKKAEETLEEAYEIERCVAWIKQVNVSTVALQFPDELLVDAPDVALEIEQKSNVEVYVLGDTTYGRSLIKKNNNL